MYKLSYKIHNSLRIKCFVLTIILNVINVKDMLGICRHVIRSGSDIAAQLLLHPWMATYGKICLGLLVNTRYILPL